MNTFINSVVYNNDQSNENKQTKTNDGTGGRYMNFAIK